MGRKNVKKNSRRKIASAMGPGANDGWKNIDVSDINMNIMVGNRLDLSKHMEPKTMGDHFRIMELSDILYDINIEIGYFISRRTISNIDRWTWTSNLWMAFSTYVGDKYDRRMIGVLDPEAHRCMMCFIGNSLDDASDLVSDKEILESIVDWKRGLTLQRTAKLETGTGRGAVATPVAPSNTVEQLGKRDMKTHGVIKTAGEGEGMTGLPASPAFVERCAVARP